MKNCRPLAVLTVGMSLALLVAPASAESTAATITLSPSSNHPKGSVAIRGTGFGSNEIVDILFDDEQIANATTNGSGKFMTSFNVPGRATPAIHAVTATGETSGLRADAPFLVNTNWVGFRFDGQNNRYNPYENVLNRSNVSTLVNAWTFTGTTFFIGSAAVVDGVLYQASFGNEGGSVYAIDASTGANLWSVPMDVLGTPAVARGRVYVAGFEGTVFALDATTGTTLWTFSTGSNLDSSPAVANGTVYITSLDGNVYALDAATGDQRWVTASHSCCVPTSPAVVNGVVYIGAGQHLVEALDASTGRILWYSSIGGWLRYSHPTVANNVVYVGAQDDTLYALDAATGKKLWSFTTAGWDESSPTVSGGIVYVQSWYGNLYALDAATGELLWVFGAGGAESTPAVANGVLYVGDYAGAIYALDAVTGEELWSYDLGGFVDSSPVVVNGMVYIGTNLYQIYAFRLP